MTRQDQFAAALLARGEQEVPSKSRKYRAFTRTHGGFYFVGKAGALRFGPRSSASIPVSEKFKAILLAKPEEVV